MEFSGIEAGIHFPGLGGLGGGPHPLDTPFHGDGTAISLIHALERPQAQLFGRLFQLLDLRLLLQVLLHTLLITPFLLHGIEAVVSAVKLRLAVLDLNDTGHDTVQEIAVMRDYHHSSTETADILFQPFRCMKVQVVGRLVQQEDIGILQNEAAQVHPGLLSTGKLVKKLGPHMIGNRKAVCDLIDRHIGIITAKDLEALAELTIAAQDSIIGLPCRHALLHLLHLPCHALEPPKGAAQHIFHRIPHRVHRDLGNKTYPAALSYGDISLIVVQFAGQNLKKCGFSCTVAAKKSHPFALIDLEGKPVQDVLSHLKRFDQVVYLYLNHRILSAVPPGPQNAWHEMP